MKFITKKKLKEENKLLNDGIANLRLSYERKVFELNTYKLGNKHASERIEELQDEIKTLESKLKRTTTYKDRYAKVLKEKKKIIKDLTIDKKNLEENYQTLLNDDAVLEKELLEVNNDLFEARKIIDTLNKQLVKYRKDAKEYAKNKTERN